jgi:TfoX/Sxy family transcriptional regulator of competence genes
MAFDDELAHRVRILLNVRADVDEKRMFGGIVFLLAGNMSVGIRGDELIVRVGPEGSEEALRQPHTRPFDITGRPMKGWILVAAEGVRSERQIAAWVARGAGFARSLPPKG